MMRQLDHRAKGPSPSISPALLLIFSVLLMFGMSACSKTQEQDALSASQTQAHTQPQQSAATDDAASSTNNASEEASHDAAPKDAEPGAATHTGEPTAAGYVTRTPKASNLSPEEQRAAAQKLDGHWLLDADATLELLPEESREGLREVFGQVRTGVTFTEDGEAIMNVVAQGEKNEQAGKYAVSDAKEEAVRIEFLLEDPELEVHDIRIFATLIFEDEDTVHYQASTEEQGRVVQREQIAVMKRVSPEKYHNVLK